MKKLLKGIIFLMIGLVAIPALYLFSITLFGTVLGLIANPKVMMILIGIFAVLCLPGIIVGWFVKR